MTIQTGARTLRLRSLQSLALPLLLLLLAAHSAHAISFVSTNLYNLPETEISKQEIWIACEKAQIDGSAQNDLLLAAQEATLTGAFDMDLWVAAQDILYSGQTAGHIRLAAKSAIVSGTAGDNLICAASTMDITEEAHLHGNALLLGENTLFQGRLDGDLTIYAANATISGVIGGSVKVIANDIVIMPSTVIEGNLEYLTGKELFLDPNVQLGGTLQRLILPQTIKKEQSWSDRLMLQAYFYMSALIVGLAWLFFFPTLSMAAVSTARESMLRCFLIGLAFLCCFPVIIGVFFVSLLGIPLALVLAAIYGIFLYIAKIITAYALGLMLLRRPADQPFLQNAFTVLSAGMLCLYLPAAIPSLTFFIWIISACCGLGALLTALFRLRNRERLLITIGNTPPPTETEETTTEAGNPPEKES
ncbi:MAG: polymer-forming cytoskeletal protein [Kiritimatiellae bacterium]|nr:polymer-forming cytoskeletal protein [Kiritimatiellia bacterium]